MMIRGERNEGLGMGDGERIRYRYIDIYIK